MNGPPRTGDEISKEGENWSEPVPTKAASKPNMNNAKAVQYLMTPNSY
jgi:hypothetical protein